MIAIASVTATPGTAQILPLGPDRESGQSVTPAFEGWYKNPDGTFSISFGYLNRNTREVIELPIGPSNFISPADSNQGQPTRFEPQRHWGVFAVKVPADFGDKVVTWTLTYRGETYAIPGSLKRGWEIDALEGEGAAGNVPPIIRFEENGPVAQGPGGGYGAPRTAKVGVPLEITTWSVDAPSKAATPTRAAGDAGSGRASAAGAGAGAAAAGGRGRAAGAVGAGGAGGAAAQGPAVPTLAWFKHQGPGNVTFNPAAPRADRAAAGKATTQVTFSEPGTYVLRLRALEGAAASAGHAQCCWSNGFLKVTVSR